MLQLCFALGAFCRGNKKHSNNNTKNSKSSPSLKRKIIFCPARAGWYRYCYILLFAAAITHNDQWGFIKSSLIKWCMLRSLYDQHFNRLTKLRSRLCSAAAIRSLSNLLPMTWEKVWTRLLSAQRKHPASKTISNRPWVHPKYIQQSESAQCWMGGREQNWYPADTLQMSGLVRRSQGCLDRAI